MTTTWWQELLGGLALALPGVTALILGILQIIQKNKEQKTIVKKTDADIAKEKETQENELIRISSEVAGKLINNLETRIANLHAALEDLEKKCGDYEKRIDENEIEINALKAEVAAKNKRIIELERSELEKDKRIRELEDKVYALEHPEEKK